MIAAVIAFAILALVFGLLLGYSSIRFRVEGDPIADQVESILPQTQCGQCGFPGCRPYAEAIATGETEINKCAPGGEATVLALPSARAAACASASIPRAMPDTTVNPAAASPCPKRRAIRIPREDALRAPTIATAGRFKRPTSPSAQRIGGASGKSINARG